MKRGTGRQADRQGQTRCAGVGNLTWHKFASRCVVDVIPGEVDPLCRSWQMHQREAVLDLHRLSGMAHAAYGTPPRQADSTAACMCGLGTQQQILRLTRVAKLIAHEVEVALAAQGQCDHPDL